ncbi:MAG: DUF222 domain-containing protein, partial [bacterium]|nr:DUF222 domain-containing protein [bacterium]
MLDLELGILPDDTMTMAFGRDEFDVVPDRLDEMQPGPFLAAVLAHLDHSRLSGHDRIKVLRAQQRMASHYSAGVYAAMASVTEHLREEDDDYQIGTEAASAEIRAALRLTRRATEVEHSFALELHERLPSVAAALQAGDIDVRRAKTIARHSEHLTTATAQEVVGQVIGEAPHLTTGQLAAKLRRLCIETDPDEAADRYRNATDKRRLVMDPTVDGTANLLGLDLPPDRVAAGMRRINTIAKQLRGSAETRTMDQLRADILLDLIAGTQRGTKT